MRRFALPILAAAIVLSSALPAQALTRVPFVAPPQIYSLEGVCPFRVDAVERDPHEGIQVFDGHELVEVRYSGAFTTVLTSQLGATLDFDTIGSTDVTNNGDGTWTQVQLGSGLAVVPASDPTGPKLVWFSGRVESVGSFDPKSLRFDPVTQVRSGISSDVCEMLVTGLKTRH
jgi:hypothetical protein